MSVLTPVYNGEDYLAQCIESVLAQDYKEWEYTIVNNCSTDRTLEIAESYARREPRIQVRTNSAFVGAIENHNIAFKLVSKRSKYCKIVSADDWIMVDCLRKMVQLAEAHPTVGIVGCYQRSGNDVRWQGLPTTVSVIPGRDAGRLGLLKDIHVLGTPTSVLYRADLVRARKSFFPHTMAHADTSVCYECFQSCDFGFVHEVLCTERVHAEQWSAKMDRLSSWSVAYLDLMLRYGSLYMSESEFAVRRREVFEEYYRFLGRCVLKLKGREFWSFHRERAHELGWQIDWSKVLIAAVKDALTESRNPVTALRICMRAIKSRFRAD